VAFIDISQPVEPAYAVLPTIDLSLPNDFFYPFTGASSKIHVCQLLFVFVFVSIFIEFF
jgi:hypothetical protein